MRERIGGQVEHFDCIYSYKITVIIIIIRLTVCWRRWSSSSSVWDVNNIADTVSLFKGSRLLCPQIASRQRLEKDKALVTES